jgi:thymidylate kinase
MQERVRASYHRLADGENWVRLDGERPKGAIAADVFNAVSSRLALP